MRTIDARRWLARGATVLGAALLFVAADSEAAPAPSFAPNHVFVGAHDNTTNTGAVFEFDEAGSFVRKIPVQSSVGSGEFVYGVAFGPDGALYCATLFAGQVQRVDATLAVTTVLTVPDASHETVGVAFGPQGRLYVANRVPGGKVVAADASGNVLDSYTAPAALSPSYVTIGPDGHVYVSMYGTTDEITELDADLRYVRSFGVGAFGSHGYPANVVFGRGGSMFVAAYELGQVLVFGPDGAQVAPLADSIEGPYGAALGPDGLLYVSAYDGDSVLAIAPAGITIRALSTPDMDSPSGLAFAPFRFSAKLAGSVATLATSTTKLAAPPSVVSFSPGSGVVLVSVADGATPADVPSAFPETAALVFVGPDVVSPDGRSAILQGTTIGQDSGIHGTGSIGVVAKGAVDRTTGFFVPKSISGSIHLGRSGGAMVATFSSKKRVP